MKKRILAVALSITMAFACLMACGDSSTADSSKTESSSKAETTTSAADSSSESETTTTTTSATTTTTTTTTQATTTEAPKSNRVVLDFKNIQQLPELPRGSEITCTAMVLNYYGINVDKMELLQYLPTVDLPKNGKGSNPIGAYIGDPKLTTGYGCYPPVIKNLLRFRYFKNKNINDYNVKNVEEFNDLYSEIDNENPVIIWTTVGMKDIAKTLTWTDMEGWNVKWNTNEHCVVLIGYDKDKDTVIVNDPLNPKGTVEYPRAQVEKVYNQMEKQALVIFKK